MTGFDIGAGFLIQFTDSAAAVGLNIVTPVPAPYWDKENVEVVVAFDDVIAAVSFAHRANDR
jgi:cytochrome bd-type quinol oxidase subunit 2